MSSLPPLETDKALKLLGGNRDLYVSLVKRLSDRFGQTDETLSPLLENQQWEEAENLVHTLKGAAGNLCATPLFHACENLSRQLKNSIADQANTAPWEEFSDFSEALKAFVVAADQLS